MTTSTRRYPILPTGRSHCSAVASYECQAPAGIRTSRGFGALSGVRKDSLHECGECGDLVCEACSRPEGDGRVCDHHPEPPAPPAENATVTVTYGGESITFALEGTELSDAHTANGEPASRYLGNASKHFIGEQVEKALLALSAKDPR